MPLFPSYYQIQEAIKDIYVGHICSHLETHHLPHLGHYMHSQPTILLTAHHFIRESTEKLNEPNNVQYRGLYNSIRPSYPQFLTYSENSFNQRFDRIIVAQRGQEQEIIEESEQRKVQEKRRAAQA